MVCKSGRCGKWGSIRKAEIGIEEGCFREALGRRCKAIKMVQGIDLLLKYQSKLLWRAR